MEFLHSLTLAWLRIAAAIVFAAHIALGVFIGSNAHSSPVLLSTTSSPTSTPAQSIPSSPLSHPPSLVAAASSTLSTPASPLIPLPVPSATLQAPQQPSLSQSQADTQTRAALVNILCTTGASGYFNPLSGSGVIIDSRGVILTNAHVGQYFLLRNYPTTNNVQCVVRTGSPATPKYTAQLLYLPPAWIDANASQIGQRGATGTGENDYAFLLINGTLDGSPLPAAFPALTMTTDDPQGGEPVLLAAYPAELLDGDTIQQDLYISSAVTRVSQLFTFASIITSTSTVDSVSVSGTVVSQEGSSGGAVVRLQDGALTGLITTESAGTTTASRDLRAITIGHVDRSLAAEGQGSIATLLTGDLANKAADFNLNYAPTETQKLEAVLNKQ